MKRFVGRKHKGDTLVEVTLAIGIFSMVAVAAVSVINISTTGAQSSLESTITREEIDGQAEALRFIQSAYIAGGEIDESAPTKYAKLWQMISNHAIDLTDLSDGERNAVLKYNPTTCDALYTKNSTTWDSLNKQNAFIINTHAMNSSNLDDIIIDYKNNNTKFGFATTYPRIVYGSDASDALYNPAINNLSLFKAEGIYVIAVRDMKDTVVVTDSDGKIELKSAYIDFYIRSCWFTPNATRASTISTAIRLYDPDEVSINKYERKGVLIKYDKNADDATGTTPSQYVFAGDSVYPLQNRFERPGFKFMGWTSEGVTYNYDSESNSFDKQYTAPANLTESQTVTFKAVWRRIFSLTYYNTDGSVLCSEEFLSNGSDSHTFTIYGCPTAPTNPDVSKQVFQGWSESIDGREPLYDKVGGVSNIKNTITAQNGVYNLSLYPVWRIEIKFNTVDWQTETGSGSRGENIGIADNGLAGGTVEFTGDRRGPVDKSVYYNIGPDDTFELSADMNTSGMYTHPGGFVEVRIGPVKATITRPSDYENRLSVSYQCQSSSGSRDVYPGSSTVNIKMTKYGNDYSMSLNGKELITCNVPNYSNPIRVSYRMYHNSHNCSTIFQVKLTNIQMKRVIKG